MWGKRLGAGVWVVAMTWAAAGRGGATELDRAIDATCRITSSDGGRGSGCAFETSGGQVYVLTAGHVVSGGDAVQCEFWRAGHQSAPLPGRVVLRAQGGVDAAVVAVPETAFAGKLPPVVRVAPRGQTFAQGQTLTSVGCANGAWATGWKGHALGYSGSDLCFLPAPAQGRSGSALFDAEGRQIVGIVRARTVENPMGLAVSLEALYAGLGRAVAERSAQCGPGACGPGACGPGLGNRLWPRGGGLGSGPGASPAPGPGGPAWPTLPAPTPAPDLSETNRRLDYIAGLLEQLRKTEPSVPPPLLPAAPPQAAPARPEAEARLETVEQHTRQNGTALAEVKQEQGKLREGLGQLHGVVQQLAGDVTTLPERIQNRIDKVRAEGAEGARQVAQAYARDLLQEKLADGTLGWSLGKLLGAALGLSGPLALAVGGGLWAVSRRMGAKLDSGEPLWASQLVGRLAGQFEELKTRLAREKTA